MKFFTIGVYGSTEQAYFNKLIDNNIDTFCDIRQRRGVRGSKYAFVNSVRLQHKLQDLNINYLHVIELAPTKEIRELQQEDDKRKGILKKDRNVLGDVFKIVYKNKILNAFDFEGFLKELDNIGANNIVLFCVEEHHLACHRSIVAERLQRLGYEIKHL